MEKNDKKVWLITGSSSGLGRALVDAATQKGDKVIAAVRDTDPVKNKASFPEGVKVIKMDVTDPAEIKKAVQSAHESFGRIDYLVNNAGSGVYGAIEEGTDEQMCSQIETNLIGAMRVIREVLPIMREQKAGHIIQISSSLGQAVIPGFGFYDASKWGIDGFAETLNSEVSSLGIKVTIVEPGGMRTDFFTRGLVVSTPMDAYDKTPVGDIRRAMAAGQMTLVGDPLKVAKAILEISDNPNPPLRLVLGSDAYDMVKKSLQSRLEELEKYKMITMTTDVSA